MRKINKIKIAKNVIKIESKSLASIANKIGQSFQEACDIILKCKGRVVTIGLGKSGHIAAKSSATLSSTGTPSTFIHAGETLHGDIGGLKNSLKNLPQKMKVFPTFLKKVKLNLIP